MSEQPASARHRAVEPVARRAAKTFGFCVLALTVGLGLFVTYTVRTLNGNLDVMAWDGLTNRPAKESTDGPHEPLNILIMGSDTREGEGNGIDNEGGGGKYGLSDTTMILHLSGDRKSAYGVSLPRDAMVQRPDCEDDDGDTISGEFAMWNTAFALGGPLCTVQQVEQLTNIRIDHFVVVDFNGFKDMVDAVEGVEICVPEDIDDRSHGIFLEEGRRVVKGREALAYVRVRHTISQNGDIGRMKRQQVFIASLINRVMSKGVMARPDRLVTFLKAATRSLTVDEDLGSVKKMGELGWEFRDIDLDSIKFITVPWDFWVEDRNRLVWTEQADTLWRKIRKDQPLSKRLGSEAVSAAQEPGGKLADPNAEDPEVEETDEPETDEPTKSAEEIAEENGLCA